MSRHELDLIDRMKRTHLTVPAGDDLIREGDLSQTFYTVFDGWGARYHRHRNGSRQILDVLLPGDTIALAWDLLGSSAYSVQALTAASFCALDGRQFVALFNSNPKFALSILTTRLDDGRRADKRLTMLGRMSAVERVGYFLVETYDRLLQRGMAGVRVAHSRCDEPTLLTRWVCPGYTSCGRYGNFARRIWSTSRDAT